MSKKNRHKWKCQSCGLTFAVSHSREPKKCVMCPEKYGFTYQGRERVER